MECGQSCKASITRVAKIEATLQQLANVLVLTARQDERLIAIERRVDRLEQAPTARHRAKPTKSGFPA